MDNAVFSLWDGNRITAATALANISNRVLKQKIT